MGLTISLITSLLFSYSLIHLIRLIHSSRPSSPVKSVAVVVLGDVARSPRMCRHAKSFLDKGWTVHLVGYFGTPLPNELEADPHLHKHDISPPGLSSSISTAVPKPAFLLLAAVKILYTSFALFFALIRGIQPVPGWVLVQNPPAIPSLPIVQSFSFLCNVRLIIDWHNTGCSILALRLGQHHPVVRLATWLEASCGRDAALHLFVTQAEKEALTAQWKLRGRGIVFYDRPPASFRRLKEEEAHELWLRLLPNMEAKDPALKTFLDATAPSSPPHSTPFTQITKPPSPTGTYVPPIPVPSDPNQKPLVPSRPPVRWREDRPAILVSSTSWTADEDFDMFIDALSLYVRGPSASEGATKRVGSEDWSSSGTAVEVELEGSSSGEEVERPGSVKGAEEGDDWVDAGKSDSLPPSTTASPRKKGPKRLPREDDDSTLPDLICFITGKGPLQSHYRTIIASRSASEGWTNPSPGRPRVFVHLVWLESADYPLLLGSADVGVSLHLSSSGFDLPMKVVDCFGCRLPVCARAFPSLSELVKQGENGWTFDTAEELEGRLRGLVKGFRAFPGELDLLRAGIASAHYGVEGKGERGWETWEEAWERLIGPIVHP